MNLDAPVAPKLNLSSDEQELVAFLNQYRNTTQLNRSHKQIGYRLHGWSRAYPYTDPTDVTHNNPTSLATGASWR